MTLNQFVSSFMGGKWDFDKAYGAQCVDLLQYYMADVLGGGRFTGAYAKGMYGQNDAQLDWHTSGVPAPGAVVVFGSSWGAGFGHIAVVVSADANGMTCLAQNDPTGGATALHHYGYGGMVGFGNPKIAVNPAPAQTGGGKWQVRVTVGTLNVRTQPKTSAPAGQANKQYYPDGNLHAGDLANVVEQVAGDSYQVNGQTSNQWLKTERGTYIALLGTSR